MEKFYLHDYEGIINVLYDFWWRIWSMTRLPKMSQQRLSEMDSEEEKK